MTIIFYVYIRWVRYYLLLHAKFLISSHKWMQTLQQPTGSSIILWKKRCIMMVNLRYCEFQCERQQCCCEFPLIKFSITEYQNQLFIDFRYSKSAYFRVEWNAVVIEYISDLLPTLHSNMIEWNCIEKQNGVYASPFKTLTSMFISA